jgi:hypothetical protein
MRRQGERKGARLTLIYNLHFIRALERERKAKRGQTPFYAFFLCLVGWDKSKMNPNNEQSRKLGFIAFIPAYALGDDQFHGSGPAPTRCSHRPITFSTPKRSITSGALAARW